ncbi:translation initiation factor eIF-6, putative [Methanocella conradii HZ254]|uniref:Translation initiation factor 6 n=1 Tax=Methanocella conradii (strain DSM 24694 / JCM 17849 / CGMCC 1.5162 / HZ254) TaxID=1041930 RepID=H8I467_METCZ|nr:translation initiation factor IF-6 [Methanocella conradii]AFC99206.1 translation initiation factor eIF-6, putative [Methanocella conradii HZ254]MDI6897794.1 translation initiation factor IF-6 [Methanocella conradii]
MIRQLDFYGYPYVGIYATNTEDYIVVPPDLPEQVVGEAAEALGVEVIRTLINESTLIGSMMTGNSNGFIVSDLALDREVAVLEKSLPVARLKGKMTASGNIILANDTAALVHPALTDRHIEVIKKTLKVDVRRGTIGGLKTVGMAGVATNKGLLVHPRATEEELSVLEDLFRLPVDIGTVSFGSPLVGSAILANTKGLVTGTRTSGPELGRIEDALQLGE